jgi:hypothetical protein
LYFLRFPLFFLADFDGLLKGLPVKGACRHSGSLDSPALSSARRGPLEGFSAMELLGMAGPGQRGMAAIPGGQSLLCPWLTGKDDACSFKFGLNFFPEKRSVLP